MAKKKPTYLKNLSIGEVSLVTRGANQHADVILMKMDTDDPIEMAKALCESIEKVGMMTFSEILMAREGMQMARKIQEKIMMKVGILGESLHRILGSDEDDKMNLISQTLNQFEEAIGMALPRLQELMVEIDKADATANGGARSKSNFRRDNMSKQTFDAAAIEKMIAEAVGKHFEGNGDVNADDIVSSVTSAVTMVVEDTINKVSDLEKKLDDMKVGKKDDGESIVLNGETISKSVVGEATYNILKAQAEDIAKLQHSARVVEFTKKAEAEYPHLPGEPASKAEVLMKMEDMDEGSKATLIGMLKANDQAMAGVYKERGAAGVPDSDSPADTIEKLAKARADEKGEDYTTAYNEVLKTAEGAKLYNEMTQVKA